MIHFFFGKKKLSGCVKLKSRSDQKVWATKSGLEIGQFEKNLKGFKEEAKKLKKKLKVSAIFATLYK